MESDREETRGIETVGIKIKDTVFYLLFLVLFFLILFSERLDIGRAMESCSHLIVLNFTLGLDRSRRPDEWVGLLQETERQREGGERGRVKERESKIERKTESEREKAKERKREREWKTESEREREEEKRMNDKERIRAFIVKREMEID